MTRHSVRFPYERRPPSLVGPIHRPVARVELYSAVFRQWIACTMVVDTGADYCIVPSRIALHVGLESSMGQRHVATGIGGRQAILLYRNVRVRLGPWEVRVPVGVVERDDLPPLLGRYQCLDAFDLRLCNFTTTFSTRR